MFVNSARGRISLLILHIILRLNLVLLLSSRVPWRRPFIYLKPPYAIGSVPSLSGHAIAYRWRSLPRVRRHRASSRRGSSSNGCCLFRYYHGPINVRLSFPTHYWYVVEMCETENIRGYCMYVCMYGHTYIQQKYGSTG